MNFWAAGTRLGSRPRGGGPGGHGDVDFNSYEAVEKDKEVEEKDRGHGLDYVPNAMLEAVRTSCS